MSDLRAVAEAARTLRFGRDMVSWIRESNVPELFFLKWADPDRALAALDVIEAAQRNVGLPAVGTFADLLDAGDDAIETLRAALERWDALP